MRAKLFNYTKDLSKKDRGLIVEILTYGQEKKNKDVYRPPKNHDSYGSESYGEEQDDYYGEHYDEWDE